MRRITFLVLLVTLTATGAQAQDRLFIGSGEIGAFGHFGERIGDAPAAVYGQLAAGGRYVVSTFQAVDTRTGQAIVLLGGTMVGVDPRRPRVFVHDGATLSIFDLDSRLVTPLGPLDPLGPVDFSVARVRLAADANELVVLRQLPRGFVAPGEFAVIDLETRAVRRTFTFETPGAFELITDWRVTANGRRLVVLTYGMVSLVDSQSGAVLAQQRPPSGLATGAGDLVDDRINRRWYVRHQRQLTVLGDDLSLLAELPLRSNCAQSAVAFSPHTARVYVADSEGGFHYFGQPIPITHFLQAFDTETGRLLASNDITRAVGVPEGSNSCTALPLAVITAPGAPQSLNGTVTGRDVSLTWMNVGDASNFVLEAGVAPGRTDLSVSIGPASPVTISNAPPGTYYLRVRGTNAFGVSRPSNEVAVVVP